MERRKSVKRKSPQAIFEISDNDISSEHSDSDCNEPEAKIIKTDSNFVKTVVNALSNLETEKASEARHTQQSDFEKIGPEIRDESSGCQERNSETSHDVQSESLEECQSQTEGKLCEGPGEGKFDGNNSCAGDKSNSCELLEPEQCIQITFSNENMYELYKYKFLRFIESFIELEIVKEDKLSISVRRDTLLSPSEWIVLDETMLTNDDKAEAHSSLLPITPEKGLKKKKKKKTKKEKDLFVLDTNPQNENDNIMCAKYSSKFQIEIADDAEDGVEKLSSECCFNCGSSHSLKDCLLPKDYSRINGNRQKFKANKQTVRYHLEEDQKFSHLAPGKISDELREALGLKKNQLPPYIYHMRRLGYPPGWLEEAKFFHSNLELFDIEGNNVSHNESERNEGLNVEKIVDYPGFNVPMEKHVKDEYRHFQVPPYSEEYGKQVMIDYFTKQFTKKKDDTEIRDMDLDTTTEGDDKNELDCKVEPPLSNTITEKKEGENGLPSLSLTDLEKEKQHLLAALDDNSSSDPKSEDNNTSEVPDIKVSDNSGEPASSETVQANEDTETKSATEAIHIDIEAAEDCSSSHISPPLNSSLNTIKNSSFGTPILKSSSPFSRLPKADNFMKDVSPVINFENLPNSTGKYEQMTNVLQKVRSTMKQL